MKKIVIASDSFKGSLTSAEVAEHAAKGILRFFPDCEVRQVSVADGGEGTIEALLHAENGTIVTTFASDPLMRPVEVRYGITGNGSTVVIEMAEASGITRLSTAELNPLKTTSYGTGQIIAEALQKGYRNFLIGVGGTATTDGGTGLLRALGFSFTDEQGSETQEGGAGLNRIRHISSEGVMSEVSEATFTVLCDVDNPLNGKTGAASVYSPQKGADAETVKILDDGLENLSRAIQFFNGNTVTLAPGAGAGGGAAAGLLGLLNAKLLPGAEYILERISFGEILRDADLIITGEGKLDNQSSQGKMPSMILEMGMERSIPVIAIAGSVDSALDASMGFKGVFAILPSPVSLEKAMEKNFAASNVERTVGQIVNVFYGREK